MTENEGISKLQDLDDPAFLVQRAKVRGMLANAPDGSAEAAALIREYADLTAELDRRARAEWTNSARVPEPQPTLGNRDSQMDSDNRRHSYD
jgi:hypothetical protein